VDDHRTIFMLGPEQIGSLETLVMPPKGTGITLSGDYEGQQFRVVDVWLHVDNSHAEEPRANVYIDQM
jgi:hypothetical protein